MIRILLIILLLQCNHIASAQNWVALDGGLSSGGSVTTLFEDTSNNVLIVGGRFNVVGNDSMRGIACWDGQNWFPCYDDVDRGLGNYPANVWSITRYNGDLIIAGAFTKLGDSLVPFLGKWNGIRWEKIGNVSPNSPILRTFEWNNELYVVGSFDSIGNQAINNIAKWNGTTWSTVANNYVFGTGGRIDGGCVYNGTLFISGFFDDPFGNTCRLAYLSGNTWVFLPNLLTGGTSFVNEMQIYNNELYIAGLFYQNNQTPSTSIIRYDGNTWRDVGGGPDYILNPYPAVKDLYVHNNKLYAAGNFESMGGVPCLGYAIWDGLNWCGIGDTFSVNVGFSGTGLICAFRSDLIVASGFTYINSDTIYGIAKWIGGNYVDTCGNTTSISELLIDQELVVYPNPADDVVTFGGLNAAETNTLEIINMHGQIMHTISGKFSEYIFNVRTLPEGLYAIRVSNHKRTITGKLVIRH